VEDSSRRRKRLAVIGLGAVLLIVFAAWQHWAPVLAVSHDADEGGRLLAAHGQARDFSPASLWGVDRYVEDGLPGTGAREDRVRELGAYTGEVIRRARGGSWVSSPTAPAGVELQLADGTRCSPHGRVARRIEAGRTDGVAVYAQSLGVDVRPVPEWWLKR
jgi:hypothetical protein